MPFAHQGLLAQDHIQSIISRAHRRVVYAHLLGDVIKDEMVYHNRPQAVGHVANLMPNVMTLHVDEFDGLLRETVLAPLVVQELLALGHLGLEPRLVEHLVLREEDKGADKGMYKS